MDNRKPNCALIKKERLREAHDWQKCDFSEFFKSKMDALSVLPYLRHGSYFSNLLIESFIWNHAYRFDLVEPSRALDTFLCEHLPDESLTNWLTLSAQFGARKLLKRALRFKIAHPMLDSHHIQPLFRQYGALVAEIFQEILTEEESRWTKKRHMGLSNNVYHCCA